MTTIHPKKHPPIGPGPGDGTHDPWPERNPKTHPAKAHIVRKGVCDYVRPDGELCGWVHTQCTAHISARQYPAEYWGDPCGKSAIEGGFVCVTHAGNTEQVREAAERRKTRLEAEGQVGDLLAECEAAVFGRTGVDNLDTARRSTAALVMAIRNQLDLLPLRADATIDIEYDDKGSPKTVVRVAQDGLVGPDQNGVLQPHVLLRLYGEWIDRLVNVEKVSAGVGIEERRQQLAESMLDELQAGMMETFRRLELAVSEDEFRRISAQVFRERAIDTTAAELPPPPDDEDDAA